MDAAIFGIVSVIGLIIPLYAASRDTELHASSLSAIASLVFLPGRCERGGVGVAKLDDLLRAHARSIGKMLPYAIMTRAGGYWPTANTGRPSASIVCTRILLFQRIAVVACVGLGISYLVAVLIR